ncbi:MAG: hypothetical protein ACRDK7_10095 [Solirubrobacteraceae bacterium]
MAKSVKGDDAGRSNGQPAAGVQSGLAFKESLTGADKNLSNPIDQESAKPKPRGKQSAGGGFSWG